jgi:hypothetical protein
MGHMRFRIIFGSLLILGILSPPTFATWGARVSPVRQWAIVNFAKTTAVRGALLNAGEYVVVHDAEKMARGEPCTTFYSFGESGNGAQEEVVSFHCIPREREVTGKTKLTLTTVPGNTYGCTYSWGWTMDKLTEFQFAADSEGHGVPDRAPALASAEGSAEAGHVHR